MAFALPIVATDVGASAETVGNGVGGLIVPPADTKALADALGRLLDDADLRTMLGNNARATVEQKYSVEAIADFHVNVYRHFLPKGACR